MKVNWDDYSQNMENKSHAPNQPVIDVAIQNGDFSMAFCMFIRGYLQEKSPWGCHNAFSEWAL